MLGGAKDCTRTLPMACDKLNIILAEKTENCVELKEKWQNNRTHVLKICQIRNFEKTTKNKVNA